MADVQIRRKVRLDGPLSPESLQGALYTTENSAHTFIIGAVRGDAPVALSGTVTGKLKRCADNVTVPLTGSIVNGEAVVTLNSSCYLHNGRVELTIFVTENSAVTCVYACVGRVIRTDGDETIDPSGEITIDVNALLAAIEEATASIPSDYSDLLDTIAGTFSSSTAYAAGDYVWYDGTLYKFTAAHAAGSWAGTDASAVVICGDIASIASALSDAEDDIDALETAVAGKQDALTFDNSPTENSANPVKSGGVYSAISAEATRAAAAETGLGTAKADKTGSYETLTAGSADALIADTGVTDKVPYSFRATGGGVKVGTRAYDKIVGGTVCWNQMIANGNFASTDGWSISSGGTSMAASGNALTFSGAEAGTMNISLWHNADFAAGHKIAAFADVKCSAATRIQMRYPALLDNQTYSIAADTWTRCAFTATPDGTALMTQIRFQFDGVVGATYQVRNVMCFDLTLMFGPAVATGLDAAAVRALFPEDYYAYNAGEMMSVNVKAHKTTGFNLWDGEWENGSFDTETGEPVASGSYVRGKNPLRVFPNTAYYFNCTKTGCASLWARVFFYDADMNYLGYTYPYSPTSTTDANFRNPFTTPANARYMKFFLYSTYGTVGGDDICFSVSGRRNGQYESPKHRTYALDASLTLRGIPRLDASGKLYFDGDTYESDGSVTRRYVQTTFDGTESWNEYTTVGADMGGAQINVSPDAGEGRQYVLTNFAIPTQETPYNSTNYGITQIGHVLFITFPLTMFASLAAWKTYLGTHNLVVVRQIADTADTAADPYQSPQIVDAGGTEEYVDAGATASTPTRDVAIPAGHETFYPTDLKARIEGLPDDFSTLIAPTEATFTATRNYASGALLIVDNTLYQAIAAISNGATITPGTNVTATTLSEIILAMQQ